MQPTFLIVENEMIYDAIIIGGGPSGATAAMELALHNRKVAFIDREGRIKPCGGAVPPRLIRDFSIPDSQIVEKIKEKYSNLIKNSSGKVIKVEEWGLLNLATKIKKYNKQEVKIYYSG